MAKVIIKGLIVWLLVSLPAGMALGALFSAFIPGDAGIDRGRAAFNGVVAGAQLALLGGIAAAATTTFSRNTLKRVGGSECLTGGVVTYGVVLIGLLVLLVL